MASSKVYSATAREILDSRGNPTVETTVILESGYRATAAVASGASVGSYEAVELRDTDPKHYNGMGVLGAVQHVNTAIHNKIKGMDALDQKSIDEIMCDLDGTPNKSKLGANSILSVSMAVAKAAANHRKMPLYQYLNEMFSKLYPMKIERIPTPTFNIINGGMHGSGNLNFQEFHVVPATNKPFHEALELGVVTYYSAKKILSYRNAVTAVGDEGGFAPNLYTNLDALEVLTEAIRSTKYKFGLEVYLGLDIAATHFKTERGYTIKDRPVPYSTDEFITYLISLHKKYHMLLMEDALGEDDWEGWGILTKKIGQDVLIVGDDLLATNPERLSRAVKEKSCSAILAKPNQIGSLWEFLEVAALAKKHDMKIITSHRSGETVDTFIADLAVAIQSEYVKFGAPARGERVTKYNRLLAIEAELFGHKTS